MARLDEIRPLPPPERPRASGIRAEMVAKAVIKMGLRRA
jgi:hypothetical protein